jgi:hypothetical protein
MMTHELTTLVVSGLATALSGCACLLFTWLRTDIRSLAKAIASLRETHDDFRHFVDQFKGSVDRQFGILEALGRFERDQ